MNQKAKQGDEPHEVRCGQRPDPPEADAHDEPPLGRAFFRVMRALMFEEPPSPELDVLPLAQLRLFWTVFYRPDATMKDFSERLGVSQSTVTQLAERLIRRGLVERQADTLDRRVVRLHLSLLGRRILDEANARQRLTFTEVWRRFRQEERDAVIHGLDVLGRAGEALRAAQGRPLEDWPEGDPPHMIGHRESGETAQPVVDLMARRVRGRISDQ